MPKQARQRNKAHAEPGHAGPRMVKRDGLPLWNVVILVAVGLIVLGAVVAWLKSMIG
jgi:hypothetical protein